MIKLEEFQNRPFVAIVCTILLLIGSFALVMQHASADQSPQNLYKSGYNEGFKIAECDFKRCHTHGYDKTVPTGHTNQYNNGYSKGYQDGWNKASGAGGKSQQSTHNGTSNVNATSAKSQQIPNNNSVCDPTHQFCAMTTAFG